MLLRFPRLGLGKFRGIFRTAVQEDVGRKVEEETAVSMSSSSSFLFTAAFMTTQPNALK